MEHTFQIGGGAAPGFCSVLVRPLFLGTRCFCGAEATTQRDGQGACYACAEAYDMAERGQNPGMNTEDQSVGNENPPCYLCEGTDGQVNAEAMAAQGIERGPKWYMEVHDPQEPMEMPSCMHVHRGCFIAGLRGLLGWF